MQLIDKLKNTRLGYKLHVLLSRKKTVRVPEGATLILGKNLDIKRLILEPGSSLECNGYILNSLQTISLGDCSIITNNSLTNISLTKTNRRKLC